MYLGLAKVPLITLANDKPVKGTFELRKVSYPLSLHDFICRLIGFQRSLSFSEVCRTITKKSVNNTTYVNAPRGLTPRVLRGALPFFFFFFYYFFIFIFDAWDRLRHKERTTRSLVGASCQREVNVKIFICVL